jgi:hypothetical protein
MRTIDYTVSHLGWGIDHIMRCEACGLGLLTVRDYAVTVDQLTHSSGYNRESAWVQMEVLKKIYFAGRFIPYG